MEKKTVSRKSHWNVPLNRVRKSHMTPRSTVWYCWEIDCAVWYCGEIGSVQYATVGDWICAVWYHEEIDFVKYLLYDTAERYRKIRIMWAHSSVFTGATGTPLWRPLEMQCSWTVTENALQSSTILTRLLHGATRIITKEQRTRRNLNQKSKIF